jgi:hypothetical protein
MDRRIARQQLVHAWRSPPERARWQPASAASLGQNPVERKYRFRYHLAMRVDLLALGGAAALRQRTHRGTTMAAARAGAATHPRDRR